MKRLNDLPWTPWVKDRHLPIRGLDDPKEMAEAIRKDWPLRKSK